MRVPRRRYSSRVCQMAQADVPTGATRPAARPRGRHWRGMSRHSWRQWKGESDMPKLIAERSIPRQHRQWLRHLLESTRGPIRIASAYVTDRDLLVGVKNRTIQVLTFLWPWDSPWEIVSRATSLASLRSLIETGVQCRCLSDGARLHAKVYIFGDEFAVVTSGNLTTYGLDKNIEVGVQLTGSNVQELTAWFDALWKRGRPLDEKQVSDWQKRTAALSREYSDLR